jgi:hypothetical protein
MYNLFGGNARFLFETVNILCVTTQQTLLLFQQSQEFVRVTRSGAIPLAIFRQFTITITIWEIETFCKFVERNWVFLEEI